MEQVLLTTLPILSLKKDQTFFRISQRVVTGVARPIVGHCIVPTNNLMLTHNSASSMISGVFDLDGFARILVPWTVLSMLHNIWSMWRVRARLDWRDELITEESVVVAGRHGKNW